MDELVSFFINIYKDDLEKMIKDHKIVFAILILIILIIRCKPIKRQLENKVIAKADKNYGFKGGVS